jgi:hypothetical protein
VRVTIYFFFGMVGVKVDLLPLVIPQFSPD